MSVESAAYKPPELAFFCLECGEQEFGPTCLRASWTKLRATRHANAP
jgi:hypothetical protein